MNEKFFKKLQKQAEMGDINAQFYLSVIYEGGRGIAQDRAKAKAWSKKAAEAGDAQCQYRLSKTETTNQKSALYWLEKAAQNGHLEAQFELGVRYLLGVSGAIKSVSKARDYFLSAAEKNHPEANYYLGFMHYNGIGFAIDYNEATRFLTTASQLGSLKGKCSLAWMFAAGQGCQQNNERARQLYRQAADGGHVGAQFGLACLSLTTNRFDDAKTWLEIAARNGIIEAQAVLAKFYLDGPLKFRDQTRSQLFCLLVKNNKDADDASIEIVEGCLKKLTLVLTASQKQEAHHLADSWQEELTEPLEDFETDWDYQLKLEIENYETKNKQKQ
jgi:uncharacterized protein